MEKEWYSKLFDVRYSGGKDRGEITPGFRRWKKNTVRFTRSVLCGEVRIIKCDILFTAHGKLQVPQSSSGENLMVTNQQGPDFVCIGAQKAGTTWLYENLSVHPGIWMPPVKEIRFFDIVCPNEQLLGSEVPGFPFGLKRYSNRWFWPASVANMRWRYRFYNYPRSIEWYYWLFSHAAVGQKSGDITPSYSTLDERGVAFARKVLKPDCRILIILRNPIARAWSAVKMLYRWKDIDIEKTDVDLLRRNLESPSSRLRSDYVRTITLWRRVFGRNFRPFLYDDLLENQEAFLCDIQRFIGVSLHIDSSTIIQRSNADRAAIDIPKEIEATLEDIYTPEILRLDTVIPGVSSRWLNN